MKRKGLVMAIIIIFVIGVVSYSQASSFLFEAEADKTEVEAGEEVIIDMSLSEIDMKEHGINVLEGYLEYEDSFFSDMELINKNDWEVTYNNEQGERKGKFLTSKMVEGIKEKESILQIKLRVRDDVKEGETEVNLKDITSNDGESLIKGDNRTIKIKIKNKEIEKPGKQEQVESGENTTGRNEILNSEKDSNQSGEKENVNTGDNIIYAVLGIIALIIINIVIIKVQKGKK